MKLDFFRFGFPSPLSKLSCYSPLLPSSTSENRPPPVESRDRHHPNSVIQVTQLGALHSHLGAPNSVIQVTQGMVRLVHVVLLSTDRRHGLPSLVPWPPNRVSGQGLGTGVRVRVRVRDRG